MGGHKWKMPPCKKCLAQSSPAVRERTREQVRESERASEREWESKWERVWVREREREKITTTDKQWFLIKSSNNAAMPISFFLQLLKLDGKKTWLILLKMWVVLIHHQLSREWEASERHVNDSEREGACVCVWERERERERETGWEQMWCKHADEKRYYDVVSIFCVYTC